MALNFGLNFAKNNFLRITGDTKIHTISSPINTTTYISDYGSGHQAVAKIYFRPARLNNIILAIKIKAEAWQNYGNYYVQCWYGKGAGYETDEGIGDYYAWYEDEVHEESWFGIKNGLDSYYITIYLSKDSTKQFKIRNIQVEITYIDDTDIPGSFSEWIDL